MNRQIAGSAVYDLITDVVALRDSLRAEAATMWNLDSAATLAARADGVDLVLALIERS